MIALLDPIAETDPADLTVSYLLGTALLHEGQEERGGQMIQRILGNGDTAEAHILMAFTRLKANDKKGATAELDRAIELNPRLAEAYCLRGRVAFISSDLAGSKTAFRRALQLDPNSFDARLMLGTMLRQEGQLTEARLLLERAIRLRPREFRVRYQFALLCSEEGDDKRAVMLLEDLVKDAPDFIEAHRSLSSTYFRLGRPTEGRQQRKVAESLDAAIQKQDLELGRALTK